MRVASRRYSGRLFVRRVHRPGGGGQARRPGSLLRSVRCCWRLKPIAMLNGRSSLNARRQHSRGPAIGATSERFPSDSIPSCSSLSLIGGAWVGFRRQPFSDPALGRWILARSGLHRDQCSDRCTPPVACTPVKCMSLRVHGRQSASLAGFWSLDGPRGRDTAPACTPFSNRGDSMDPDSVRLSWA